MRRVLVALLIVAGLMKLISGVTSADHGAVKCGGEYSTGQKACLGVVNPLIRDRVWAKGELTYCLDSRATAYPGFRAQVAEKHGQFASSLGIPAREVPYSTLATGGCDIRHDMPDNHRCGSCAAWVFTQNLPVVIEYRWQLGYVDWGTAITHEIEHAECLADEHYDKVNFVSYLQTYGRWIHGQPTVMDFGTGVEDLTQYDIELCKATLIPYALVIYKGQHNTGERFIFYCDGDGGNRRTTRIALMKEDYVYGYYWTGEYVPVVGKGQCQGWLVSGNPGDCYRVNQEVAGWVATWQRGDLRNDRLKVCF